MRAQEHTLSLFSLQRREREIEGLLQSSCYVYPKRWHDPPDCLDPHRQHTAHSCKSPKISLVPSTLWHHLPCEHGIHLNGTDCCLDRVYTWICMKRHTHLNPAFVLIGTPCIVFTRVIQSGQMWFPVPFKREHKWVVVIVICILLSAMCVCVCARVCPAMTKYLYSG